MGEFLKDGEFVTINNKRHDGDTTTHPISGVSYRSIVSAEEQDTDKGQEKTDWINGVIKDIPQLYKPNGIVDVFNRPNATSYVRTPHGDVSLDLYQAATGQAVFDDSFGYAGIDDEDIPLYQAYSRHKFKGAPPKFKRWEYKQTSNESVKKEFPGVVNRTLGSKVLGKDVLSKKFEKQFIEKTEVDDFDIQYVEKQMKYLDFMRDNYVKGVIGKDQWLNVLGKIMTGESAKRIHAVNWFKNQSHKPSAVTSIEQTQRASEFARTNHVYVKNDRDVVSIAGVVQSALGIRPEGKMTQWEASVRGMNPMVQADEWSAAQQAMMSKQKIEGWKIEEAVKHLSVEDQMYALELQKSRGDMSAANFIQNRDVAEETQITQEGTDPILGFALMVGATATNPGMTGAGRVAGIGLGLLGKGVGAVSTKFAPKILQHRVDQAVMSPVAQSLIGKVVTSVPKGAAHGGAFSLAATAGNFADGVNKDYTMEQYLAEAKGMAEFGAMLAPLGTLAGAGIGKYKAMRAEKKAAREALAVDVKSIKQIDEHIAEREKAAAEEASRKPAEKKTQEEKVTDKVAEIQVVQTEHEADLVDAIEVEDELFKETLVVEHTAQVQEDLGLPEGTSIEDLNTSDDTTAIDSELKVGDRVTDMTGEEFTVDSVTDKQVHVSNAEGSTSGIHEQFTKVQPKVEEVKTETIEPEHALTVAQNETEKAVAQLHVTNSDLKLVEEAFAPVEKELKTEFPEEAAVKHDGNWRPDGMFPENKIAGQHVGVFGKLGNKLNKLNAKQLLNTGRLAVDHILNFKLKELNKTMGKLLSKGLTKDMAKQVNWLMNNNTVKRKVDLLKVLEMDAITAHQDIKEALDYYKTVEKIEGFATVEDLKGIRIGSIGGLDKTEMEKAGLFDKEQFDDEGFTDSVIAPEDSSVNANIEEQVNSLGDKRNEEFRTALINRIERTREKIKEYQEKWDTLWDADENKPRGGLPASQVKEAKDMAALRLRNAQELMNSLEQLAGVFVQKMEALEVQKMSEGLDSVAMAEGALEDFRYKWKLFSLSKEQKLVEISRLERELEKDLSFEEETDIELNISILKTNMEDEVARTNMKANIINLGKAAEERMQMAIKQQEEFKKNYAKELEDRGIKPTLKYKPAKLTVDLSAVDIVKRGKSSEELDRLLDVKRDLKEGVVTQDTELMRTAFMNSDRFDFGDEAEINKGLKDWVDALIIKQQGLIEGHGRSKTEVVKQKLLEEFGEVTPEMLYAHTLNNPKLKALQTTLSEINEKTPSEVYIRQHQQWKKLNPKGSKEDFKQYLKEQIASETGKGKVVWTTSGKNKGKIFTEFGEQYFMRKKELEGSRVFERSQKQELTGALRYRVGEFGEEGVESSDTSTSRQVIDAEKGHMGQDEDGNRGLDPNEFEDIDVRQIDPRIEVQRPSNALVKIQEIEEILFGKEKTQDTVKFPVDAKTGKMTMEGDFGKKYDGDAYRNQSEWADDSLAAKLHKEEFITWKMLPENMGKDFKQWAWQRFRELKDYRFDNPNYKRIANDLKNEAMKAEREKLAEEYRRKDVPEEQIEKMIDLNMEDRQWGEFEPTDQEVLGRYEQDKGDYIRERELNPTQRYVNPYVHGVMKELELTRTTSLMKLKRENASEKAITISDLTYRLEKLLEEKEALETEEAFNARKPEFEPGKVYTETEMLTGLDEKGLVNKVKDLGNKNWGGANKESFDIIENKVIDEMARLQEEAMKKKAAEFEANKKPKKKKFKPETKRTRAEAEKKKLRKEGIVADKTFVEALSEAIEATDSLLKEEQRAITEQTKIDIAEGGSETWSANELIEFRKNLKEAIDVERLIKSKETEVIVKKLDLEKTNADIVEETTAAVSETKPPCK